MMIKPSENLCKINFLIGKIVSVAPFPKARNPSYKVQVQFSPSPSTTTATTTTTTNTTTLLNNKANGQSNEAQNEQTYHPLILQTSAQLPITYPNKDELIGKFVLGITNLPQKNIANYMSQFLLTGFPNPSQKVHLCMIRSINQLKETVQSLEGLQLCGWEHLDKNVLMKELLNFDQLHEYLNDVKCAQVISVCGEFHQEFELLLDDKGETETVIAHLPLKLDTCFVSVSSIIGTKVIFGPTSSIMTNETKDGNNKMLENSQDHNHNHHMMSTSTSSSTKTSFFIFSVPSDKSDHCIPLGIDYDSTAILGSHLY